jgi:GR25 family glycosyltransferase involved in LPS biosynthesis
MTDSTPHPLFARFVSGQAKLNELDADAQDRARWSLLDDLCGPEEHRYSSGACEDNLSKHHQLDPWKSELMDMSKYDVGSSKMHVFLPRSLDAPKILFTITTCKRLSLFVRTMHSFLRHCRDCWRISEWVALDDGSSEEDVHIMRKTFPFLNVYSKKQLGLAKGHAHSLNELWWNRGVKRGFDFIFHMEDDWQFFRSDNYIDKCLRAFEVEQPSLHYLPSPDQILINRIYGETVFCLSCMGGTWDERKKIWHHDHRAPDPRAQQIMRSEENRSKIPGRAIHGSHTYWPGFSLRPGMIRTSSIKNCIPFTTQGRHFEMEFSRRWSGQTSFLPEISAWHIGRLTSERFDTAHTLNAYELNGVDQFGETTTQPVQKADINNKDEQQSSPLSPINIPERLEHGYADVCPPALIHSSAIPAPAQSFAGSMSHRQMHQFLYSLGADRIRLDEYRTNGMYNTLTTEFTVWVINLNRRPDRLQTFLERHGHPLRHMQVLRVSATDGKAQVSNHHWDRLASYGDFHHHSGILGCAMSHIRLWQMLVESNLEYMIVLEDDCVLAPDFHECIHHQVSPLLSNHHHDSWKLVWLGFHPSEHHWLAGTKSDYVTGQVRSSVDIPPTGDIVLQRWDARIMRQQTVGGTHGYLIHKRGAKEMLECIQKNGMRNAIDWEMWHCSDTYVCIPPLVHAPHPLLKDSPLDTDIPIQAMSVDVSLFGGQLEMDLEQRERSYIYTLMNMTQTPSSEPVLLLHVPVSRWHAQRPSILCEWGAHESWFWWTHDLIWFQLQEHQFNQHPQGEQPLLHNLALMVREEFSIEVDLMYLSNQSVLAIVNRDRFDMNKVKQHFCLGTNQLDLEWVKMLN